MAGSASLVKRAACSTVGSLEPSRQFSGMPALRLPMAFPMAEGMTPWAEAGVAKSVADSNAGEAAQKLEVARGV